MVRVKVTFIGSVEVEGEPGVRVDFTSIAPSSIIDKSSEDVLYAQQMIRGLLSGLQQAGLVPKYGTPRLIVYLTEKEYKALGSPQINQIYELIFDRGIRLEKVTKETDSTTSPPSHSDLSTREAW
ncbi:MAG: arcadin 1 [Crenarchaeota archaeon]|nr:arcadin 1 [Thermoproteota archaeon]MDW8034367.1 arcadin 1 [Nitrososphaerota archaeon]